MNSTHHTPTTPLVFLAGPLRSGSTLLSLMLDRHSCLLAPGEFDFLFDAFGPDGGLRAAQDMRAARLDDFLSDDRTYLARSKRFASSGSSVERIRGYVDQYVEQDSYSTLCIHRNFVSAHEIFPGARFIHLLRDPRDCAKSAIGAGFAANVYFGLKPWIESETSWERLRPRLSPSQFIEVRYEELVAQPVQELTRLCAFIGLAFEPQMLDLSATTYDTPSPRFANQWLRSMSPLDVDLVEARVGPLMEARGYTPVGAKIARPASSRLPALWLHDFLFRHQRRVRNFGFSLWLQDVVSRHLGLRAWSRSVQLKMHPIVNKTLK